VRCRCLKHSRTSSPLFSMPLPRPCLDCNRITEAGKSRCRPCAAAKKRIWNARAAEKRQQLERAAASAEGGGGHRRLRRKVNLEGGAFCANCGKWFASGQIKVDHIIPLSQGGGDRDEDVQTLDFWCHKAKTSREASARRK